MMLTIFHDEYHKTYRDDGGRRAHHHRLFYSHIIQTTEGRLMDRMLRLAWWFILYFYAFIGAYHVALAWLTP